MNNCGKCNHSCNHNKHDQGQDDDYLVKLYIEVEVDKDKEYHKALMSNLRSYPGVKEVCLEGDCLEILYDDMINSPEEIKEFLK